MNLAGQAEGRVLPNARAGASQIDDVIQRPPVRAGLDRQRWMTHIGSAGSARLANQLGQPGSRNLRSH